MKENACFLKSPRCSSDRFEPTHRAATRETRMTVPHGRRLRLGLRLRSVRLFDFATETPSSPPHAVNLAGQLQR